MSNHYRYGIRKELQVGEFLERRGSKWEQSKGSRGPGDIIAKKGRKLLLIQVKATRQDRISSKRLSPDGEKRLILAARKMGASPVLALVSKNYCWILDVPKANMLTKGNLLPLKYEYEDQ